MPGLVTQHPGQLGIRFEQGVQRAGDEDLPAGQGEGVHCLRVGQQVVGKLVGCGMGRRLLDEDSANLLHALLIGSTGAQTAELGGHIGRSLQAHGDLLVGRHGDVLDLVGERVVGISLGDGDWFGCTAVRP